jgi:hypothetical protein
MLQKETEMARTQSWLHELRTLVLQYLAVVFASIPAGILYVLTMRVTGAHYVALIASIAVGVLLAHLVWYSVDQKTSQSINQFLLGQTSDNHQFDVAMSLEKTGMAVTLTFRTHREIAVKPLSKDPKDIGLYVVTSYDKFFEPLLQ